MYIVYMKSLGKLFITIHNALDVIISVHTILHGS